MLLFLRPKNEKDIGEKLLGKLKKYRLTRNGATMAVTGSLLAFFRREDEPDGLMPPAAGRVELLAVLLTKAGRYFLYYIVAYPETEDIAGRHEYAHACDTLDAVRAFLGAMQYPNRQDFANAVLALTVQTRERLRGKGKPAPPRACGESAPARPESPENGSGTSPT